MTITVKILPTRQIFFSGDCPFSADSQMGRFLNFDAIIMPTGLIKPSRATAGFLPALMAFDSSENTVKIVPRKKTTAPIIKFISTANGSIVSKGIGKLRLWSKAKTAIINPAACKIRPIKVSKILIYFDFIALAL